jgi:ribosomal protein L7Ae-like RNA K-turn-binding protein
MVELSSWSIKDLKPNSLNGQIFSDSLEGVGDLARSLVELGQLVPLLVTRDGEIVDGERRYRAALRAGVQSLTCQVVPDPTPEELEAHILDSCTAGRVLSLPEQVAIYTRTVERLKREHGIRQGRGRNNGQMAKISSPGQDGHLANLLPDGNNGQMAKISLTLQEAQEEAARRARFSSVKQALRAMKVVAGGTKEDLEAIRRGDLTISKAYGLLKKRSRAVPAKEDSVEQDPLQDLLAPEVAPEEARRAHLREAIQVIGQEATRIGGQEGFEAVKAWLAPLLKGWLEAGKDGVSHGTS